MPLVGESAKDAAQVFAIREFNRFYTALLGLLRKRYLDGEFSLTEARILYEIESSPKLTASTLRNSLGLDAGYVSRILALLTKRKLVRQTASRADGREKLLTLGTTGQKKLAELNQQSALQIQRLLRPLSAAERDLVVVSLSKVRSILSKDQRPAARIVRLAKVNDDALRLLQEYYGAINVVQQDSPEVVQKIIDDTSSGMWLAYMDHEAVGCVVLRRLESFSFAGECKRLYVQPRARGHGIANALLDAQERHARSEGLQWIYLDSHDGLKAAIALYQKRGYVPCERYNDNPQATVFLRKRIGLDNSRLRNHKGERRGRKR
ncbi:MAG: MarR family transcriptional regulator [Acidobacteria bacterium]|nr:MAG: MarR family transcriptional regulator [Acidobacteriota bacterium]PYV72947.1 MAG: MarR family transcriptional regulator [Acidobacteriota bacterium]PYV78706.1 MAG: MarR family transcriptional regulator [Acidobacteriota bacterium]